MMNGGISTPVQDWAPTFYAATGTNQGISVGYDLLVHYNGAGGPATAGHAVIWVLLARLP